MPASDDIILEVDAVSKRFCRDLKRSLWYGIKDIAGDCLGGSTDRAELRPSEFWALRDVSFTVRRGECLGLIGSNGAGKTTLLRLISGLIKPDHGAIRRRGRLGALIALGAGFNPVLSGRENIYVNAAILGLSKKETDDRLDEIIAFADIGDALEAPVQSYSSGMTVRLGFAIAAHLEPDLLLIDEVLAVGDVAFRMKCFSRLLEIRSQAAVVIVSHSRTALERMCNGGAFLESGHMRFHGSLTKALDAYSASSAATDSANLPAPELTGQTRDRLELRLSAIPPKTMVATFFIHSPEFGQIAAVPISGVPALVALDLGAINPGHYRLQVHFRAADHTHITGTTGSLDFEIPGTVNPWIGPYGPVRLGIQPLT